MSKKKSKARAEPKKGSTKQVFLCSSDGFELLACSGYTRLDHNPEVVAVVDKVSKLIGSMTIHLMQNSETGDTRVKNGLSRKIDIDPNRNMTRTTFIQWVVKTLYLGGNGNAVVYPYTKNGLLEELRPIPPSMVSFLQDGIWDYEIFVNGQSYSPDEMLHFVLNPDESYPWKGTGYRVALSEVANNLKQAAKTEKEFMSSKWKPSLVVKVDALIDEFSSPEGRKNLLESYIGTGEAGQPWLIPAEQFEVEQIKPLSLSDLAIADVVELDKRTVASILGVPPFLLGIGEFNRDAWNNFINSMIMPLARMIEQEFTKKLLYAENLYFRFNARSLYSYELRDLAAIADDQFVRGIMSGNEVRDWIGVPPKEGLDELVILENYIPRGMIGDQNKLKQGGEE